MTENPSDRMRRHAHTCNAQNAAIRCALRKQGVAPMKRVKLKTKSEMRPPSEPDAPARQLLPFGPPALMEGEDATAYDDLLARVSTAVKPADIIDDIWVRDIVDLTWEAFRLRRLIAAQLTASAHIGLEVVLRPLLDEGIGELVEAWARGERRAIQQVKGILGSANLTMDAVIAAAVSAQIEQLERMERMLAMVEARRNATLREIDRRRATRSHALRRTLDQVEDCQLRIVDDTKSDQGKKAA
jgi:hypothetical protein